MCERSVAMGIAPPGCDAYPEQVAVVRHRTGVQQGDQEEFRARHPLGDRSGRVHRADDERLELLGVDLLPGG